MGEGKVMKREVEGRNERKNETETCERCRRL